MSTYRKEYSGNSEAQKLIKQAMKNKARKKQAEKR